MRGRVPRCENEGAEHQHRQTLSGGHHFFHICATLRNTGSAGHATACIGQLTYGLEPEGLHQGAASSPRWKHAATAIQSRLQTLSFGDDMRGTCATRLRPSPLLRSQLICGFELAPARIRFAVRAVSFRRVRCHLVRTRSLRIPLETPRRRPPTSRGLCP